MRNKMKILKDVKIGITHEAREILDLANDDETTFLGSNIIRTCN